MGTLTGADFEAELRFQLFNRPDSSVDTSQARIYMWINAAYYHVGHPSVHRHRQLQTSHTYTLATSTNSYSLTNATLGFYYNAIRSVVWFDTTGTPGPTTNKNRLKPKDYNAWFNDRTLQSGGTPNFYGIDGELLYIDPVPASSENGEKLTVRFYKNPVALTSGTATVLPPIWDEVILLGARWRAEYGIGYRERAELTKQDYAALLNEYKEIEDIEIQEDIEWMPDLNRGDPVMP